MYIICKYIQVYIIHRVYISKYELGHGLIIVRCQYEARIEEGDVDHLCNDIASHVVKQNY